MRNSITIDKLDVINNQRINTLVNLGSSSIDLGGSNPVLRTLKNEEGENFANYIDQIGLAKDPNLLVLSSLHHYYYDAEEMTNVKTVVNLKELKL